MTEEVQITKSNLTIERIALGCCVALLGWVTLSVHNQAVSVATLTAQLNSIESQIQSFSRDRYTRSEAVSDQALLVQRITDVEKDIESLEREVYERTDP